MEKKILEALRQVQDPDLHKDIVSLGFIKNLKIDQGAVAFDLELTTPACPVKDKLLAECQRVVKAVEGVQKVDIKMTAKVRPLVQSQIQALAQVKNIIAVASGKGGVGKSTVALNLALALSKTGAKTGLLDADIYGPSIPMMLSILEKPFVRGDKIIPIEKFGIKSMSMGLLMGEETPVIWRGPMVTGILKQFLSQVEWGALDYLVMDLPPGTGDAQLTLTQTAPISGAVIVTTPQEISLMDATRGLKMFQQVNVPVLGIVENMSYFICDGCEKRHNIFREGGGGRIAKELNLPLLAEIPLDPSVALGSDLGEPVVVCKPDSEITKIYRDLAGRVAASLSILSEKKTSPQELHLKW